MQFFLNDMFPLDQGWPTIQKPRATFLTVFLQRAKSCTRYNDRMNITPPLTHINTYLCSARFIVNVTHQYDNDRNLQAIYYLAYYLVSGNSDIPFLKQSSSNRACIPLLSLEATLSHECQSVQIGALISRDLR